MSFFYFFSFLFQLCQIVLQALGPMFSLLPDERVTEQIPKFVPVLLGLYKRNTDPHPVTQCLAMVLHVAINHRKESLEPLLDNLLNIMFDLVSSSSPVH